MKTKLFSLSLLLTGCGTGRAEEETPTSHYTWKAEYLPIGPDRYENDEVICYALGQGLQCKWKEPVK